MLQAPIDASLETFSTSKVASTPRLHLQYAREYHLHRAEPAGSPSFGPPIPFRTGTGGAARSLGVARVCRMTDSRPPRLQNRETASLRVDMKPAALTSPSVAGDGNECYVTEPSRKVIEAKKLMGAGSTGPQRVDAPSCLHGVEWNAMLAARPGTHARESSWSGVSKDGA